MQSAVMHRFQIFIGRQNSPLIRLSHKDSHFEYFQFRGGRACAKGNFDLPPNFKDLPNSEVIAFSKSRVRDVAGTYIDTTYGSKYSASLRDHESMFGFYASGSINLHSVMQSNVPYPFRSETKPTHLNMPGGPWRRQTKYISNQLHKYHPVNFSFSAGFSSSVLGKLRLPPNGETVPYPSNTLSSQGKCFYSAGKENVSEKDNFDELKNERLTKTERLKAAVKQYGGTVVVLHITLSLTTLWICYMIVASGVDMEEILKKWGWSEGATTAGAVGPFVVAYAIHKALAPFRISLSLALTPFVVRYLRKKGFKLKPK